MFKTVEYKNGKVILIDQTRLPLEEVYVECDNYQDVAKAIKIMQVRGAPAIGVAAAMGVAIGAKNITINRAMGMNGQELIEDGDTILTHCNAGALATAGEYGTALGVIKVAHEMGKKIKVYADETRPFLQGARLTAWELVKEGIPVRLITDNMAGYFMGKGEINKIIVGADRIAANGDTANKIGTYSLSILAKEHNI